MPVRASGRAIHVTLWANGNVGLEHGEIPPNFSDLNCIFLIYCRFLVFKPNFRQVSHAFFSLNPKFQFQTYFLTFHNFIMEFVKNGCFAIKNKKT